jgi:hypothetical protein
MNEILKDIGINIGLIVAGFFGSLLMLSKNSSENLKSTLISIVTGVASANYLTPLVIEMFKVERQSYTLSIAFILGFLGLKGVEYITSKFIKNHSNGNNNKSNS